MKLFFVIKTIGRQTAIRQLDVFWMKLKGNGEWLVFVSNSILIVIRTKVRIKLLCKWRDSGLICHKIRNDSRYKQFFVSNVN